MGVKGLGKHSPIQLRLSRSNYEAAIVRHGQHVRWMKGEKCTCILDTGRPDVQCPFCRGDGWKYDFQKQGDIYDQDAVVTGDWICEVRNGDAIEDVISLMDYRKQEEYTIKEVDGKYIQFSGERKPQKNELLKVSYIKSFTENLTVNCKYLGNNHFEADVYIRTEYGRVTGDILSVSQMENETKTETYTVSGFFKNKIVIEEPAIEPEATDVVTATLNYLPPFVFLIVHQLAKEIDQQFLKEIGGDASLTFPNYCKIGEGDVITLLVGTQTQKRILTKSTAESNSTVPEEVCALLNELKTKYEAHRIFTTDGVHGTEDNTNVVTAEDAAAKATAITLANELKARFNDHCALVDSVHGAADTTNPVTLDNLGGNAIWSEISAIAEAIKTGYEAHRVMVANAVHGAADTTNMVMAIAGHFDRVPEFYVATIQSLETLTTEYVQGTDYVLFDRNRIEWIGNAPAPAEKMFVLFDFHPTYRVLREFPQVRSSENQRFPKRVALKLLSAGGRVEEEI